MATPWFFVESIPDEGVVSLPREEAKHATGARRLGAGDAIVLFDGVGTVATASLLGTRDRSGDVEARVDSIETHEAIAPRLEIATALPKGDRLSTLLDMATQAGVDHVIPLRCEWGVVKPREAPPDRWQRIVVEAAKQSRRAWLPTFGPPMNVSEACAAREGLQVLIAHPDGESIANACTAIAKSVSTIRVLIGPEGGFSDGELAAAKTTGVARVSLSPHVLRVETAAVVAAAHVRGASAVHASD
jgi:16S rRNA (uracil1498-N3)-methyltransferase